MSEAFQEQLESELGLDPSVSRGLKDPALGLILTELTASCRRLAGRFKTEIDRAPVLASRRAYAARIDHEDRRIVLNGYVLDRFTDSERLRQFLEIHELCHEYCRLHPKERDRLVAELGLEEEQACDLVALYALQKNPASTR